MVPLAMSCKRSFHFSRAHNLVSRGLTVIPEL
jgi:hypothetical protein